MIEMKEFIIKFLNIEERHYADTLISTKMCSDLMEAYHQEMKRIEKPEDYFGRNATNSEPINCTATTPSEFLTFTANQPL